MHKMLIGVFAAAGLLNAASAAQATTNLLVNGDFEQFSSTTAAQVADAANAPTGGILTGWTNAGYTYLFTPGSAYTTGSTSVQYSTLYLYGPGTNGGNVNNGMTATSPTGGNFIGSDGAYESGPISQTVSGLLVGGEYYLTFWWAAAQQYGFQGNTTEGWGVTFGSETYNTSVVNNPYEGFQPWTQSFVSFVATSATETLSFLAAGTPNGSPPFSLLDGVVLSYAPEPASWALFGVGLIVVFSLAHRRRVWANQRSGETMS